MKCEGNEGHNLLMFCYLKNAVGKKAFTDSHYVFMELNLNFLFSENALSM